MQCLDLISLFPKATSRNIFVSTDLDPDFSSGLYPIHGTFQVFSESSNIEPHTSPLPTQTGFIIHLSCDLEPDIINSTSSKIVISSDLDPDLSAGLDSGRSIS